MPNHLDTNDTDTWDNLRIHHPEKWTSRQIIPFFVFLGMLLLLQIVNSFYQSDLASDSWWRRAPEQWIYPLQTLICLALLVRWWRSYEFRWNLKWSIIGAVFGIIGISAWLLPAELYDRIEISDAVWWKYLGIQERKDGFDPSEVFSAGGIAWWSAYIFRFLRAVVVVALVEEIFWRSFLMRLCEDWHGDYWKRSFGNFAWRSFFVVTLAFMLAHAPVDYLGAIIYGSLTYLLCVWSKNLGACVIMHAVANGVMGWYVIVTGKTGLW